MKKFIEYISQFGTLSPQQIELILSRKSDIILKKDDYFAEAGKPFNRVAFVLEGVLRICYYNNKGEEITKYFIEENHLVANPYRDELFTEYIHAATDCHLIVFSQQNWEELSSLIDGWDGIISKIFHHALMEKLDRRSALVSEDATTRYLKFLELFPALANRIPLSYIASYLGITPSSLSRIRKNTH